MLQHLLLLQQQRRLCSPRPQTAAALAPVPLQEETCEVFTASVYNPKGATEATALSAICEQNLKVTGSAGKGEQCCPLRRCNLPAPRACHGLAVASPSSSSCCKVEGSSQPAAGLPVTR